MGFSTITLWISVWLVISMCTVLCTEILVFNANSEDPDQMLCSTVSDLSALFASYPFWGFPYQNGLICKKKKKKSIYIRAQLFKVPLA